MIDNSICYVCISVIVLRYITDDIEISSDNDDDDSSKEDFENFLLNVTSLNSISRSSNCFL